MIPLLSSEAIRRTLSKLTILLIHSTPLMACRLAVMALCQDMMVRLANLPILIREELALGQKLSKPTLGKLRRNGQDKALFQPGSLRLVVSQSTLRLLK